MEHVGRRGFLIGAVAFAVGACSSTAADGRGDLGLPDPADLDHITPGDSADPNNPSGGSSTHPPSSFDEIFAIFDPIYQPMGLTITRAVLIDRSNGGYVSSPTGNHLALYVEPIDDPNYSVDDYVDAIVPVTAASAPVTFDRWSGIDSYDICQEPAQVDDPRKDPFPVTQIEFGRTEYNSIDFDTVTLPELIAVTLRSPDTARLAVSAPIRENEKYLAALVQAQEAVAEVESG